MTCTGTRHGTLDAYMHHRCRCPAARRAHMRRMKDYRLRRLAGETPWVDATGTRRRIRALVAIGWPQTELGARLGGITNSAVSSYASPKRRFVTARTAAAVAALYDALADTPGPSRYNATRMRGKGWLPPLWWDDDTIDDPTYEPPLVDVTSRSHVDPVVVDRLVDGGYTGRSTPAEKFAAYCRLIAGGAGFHEIESKLRTNGTQLRKWAERKADIDAAAIGAAA